VKTTERNHGKNRKVNVQTEDEEGYVNNKPTAAKEKKVKIGVTTQYFGGYTLEY